MGPAPIDVEIADQTPLFPVEGSHSRSGVTIPRGTLLNWLTPLSCLRRLLMRRWRSGLMQQSLIHGRYGSPRHDDGIGGA